MSMTVDLRLSCHMNSIICGCGGDVADLFVPLTLTKQISFIQAHVSLLLALLVMGLQPAFGWDLDAFD